LKRVESGQLNELAGERGPRWIPIVKRTQKKRPKFSASLPWEAWTSASGADTTNGNTTWTSLWTARSSGPGAPKARRHLPSRGIATLLYRQLPEVRVNAHKSARKASSLPQATGGAPYSCSGAEILKRSVPLAGWRIRHLDEIPLPALSVSHRC